MALGEVRLELPASPDSLRLARILVAGVASRGGFTLDTLQDLRLAIDELCHALIGGGREGTLTLRLRLVPEGLEVHGQGQFGDSGREGSLSAWSEKILETVVDYFDFSLTAGEAGFHMVKRLTTTT